MSGSSFEEAIVAMTERIVQTAQTINPGDGFPHFAETGTGEWSLSPGGDWTGGFWNGMLWLTYATGGDSRIGEWADNWGEALRPRAESSTVFRGFLFYYGAALGYLLAGHETAREIALEGARGLHGDFNQAGRVLPLGTQAEEASNVGDDEVNIDGAQAGALLVWAGHETGDAALIEAGVAHTLRYIDLFVRDDASVGQSVTIDVETGEALRHYTHKGYSDHSTWTRAQAWAMLGFSLNYHYIDDPRFLDAAIQVSDWWLDHIPQDLVAYWDFDAPITPATKRDTSGTAIAAASLLKLSSVVGEPAKERRYREAGEATVAALVDDYLTPLDSGDKRAPGMLTQGCYNHALNLATDNELVWGDYYLLECLYRLEGRLTVVV